MTTRWDVERALRASGLKPLDKLVVLTIATWTDARTATTQAAHTPSLTDLARACSLDRTTIARHLTRLERDGWVIRHRPPVDKARSDKARTRYRLMAPVPLASGTSATSASGSRATTASGTSATQESDLEPSQTTRARAREDDDEVIETVIRVIRETTGRTASREHAAKVVRDILGDRRPRNPVGYVEKAIRNDPDRFKPYSGPPRFRGGRFIEEDDS